MPDDSAAPSPLADLGPTLQKMARELRIDSKLSLPTGLVVEQIVRMRRQGLSYRAIAQALEDAGWPTQRGGQWQPATVRGLLIQHGPTALAQHARSASFAAAFREEMEDRIKARQSCLP